jgi:hypothetical protein
VFENVELVAVQKGILTRVERGYEIAGHSAFGY